MKNKLKSFTQPKNKIKIKSLFQILHPTMIFALLRNFYFFVQKKLN